MIFIGAIIATMPKFVGQIFSKELTLEFLEK